MAMKRSHCSDANDIWQPCLTPLERLESFVELDFNFWMQHRFISDTELQQLINYILLKSPKPSYFALNRDMDSTNTIILASVHNMCPKTLCHLLASNKLPFLSKCTAVPVRHSVTATLEELPRSCNISVPDCSWRHTDVCSMTALCMWPVVPAVTFTELSRLRGDIAAIFRGYRLIFNTTLLSGVHIWSLAAFDTAIEEARGKGFVPECEGDWIALDGDVVGKTHCKELGCGIFRLHRAAAGTWRLYIHWLGINESYRLVYSPSDLNTEKTCSGCLDWVFKHEPTGKSVVRRLLSTHKSNSLKTMSVIDVRADKNTVASWIVTDSGPGSGSAAVSVSPTSAPVLGKKRKIDWDVGAGPTCEPEEGEETEACVGAALEPSVQVGRSVTRPMGSALTRGDRSGEKECHWSRLRNMYEQCMARGGFLEMVCSEEVLGMAGYVFDSPNVAADQLPPSAVFGQTEVSHCGTDLEEGEEAEEVMQGGSQEGSQLCDDVLSNKYISGALGICSLDCEMCETAAGNALTRLSVVCPVGGVVLDMLVMPDQPITNYNTKYSGITADMMTNVTATKADAIRKLYELIEDRTILVGHSLESDLTALGINHRRIIDTAVLFPHPNGLPYKLSLRRLTEIHLDRCIQESTEEETEEAAVGGHDSIEDSAAALELAMYRTLHRTVAVLPPSLWNGTQGTAERYTIFHDLSRNLRGTSVNFSLHQCEQHSHLPEWERFALGHNSEANMEFSYRKYIADPFTSREAKDTISVSIRKHDVAQDAASAAIHSVRSICPDQRTIVWLDIPFAADTNPSCGIDSSGLDANVEQLYESAPNGSLLVLATQGSFSDVRKLLAKKQRSKWRDPTPWLDTDEAELTQAVAHAIIAAELRKVGTRYRLALLYSSLSRLPTLAPPQTPRQ